MPIPFKIGQLVCTQGTHQLVEENFAEFFSIFQGRYKQNDWGDLDAHDKACNDEAVLVGGRILASYILADEKIWIITEWDRSVTTVLLPEEY
jgi:hypothetical protein